MTGEEFEALMEVVVKLHWVTTEEGGREVAAIISEQAELGTPFKVCIHTLVYVVLLCCAI